MAQKQETETPAEFEEVLNREVGQFGRFQLINLLLLALPAISSGFLAGDYNITAVMSCGKRPLVKNWDKPKHLRVITSSKYEQNEASVKIHWKNVIRNLELSYKDETFWDSHYQDVRTLVGPVIFKRITKVFQLPRDDKVYITKSETSTPQASEMFYQATTAVATQSRMQATFSTTDFDDSMYDDAGEEEEIEEQSIWSESTQSADLKRSSRSKSMTRSKSISTTRARKSISKSFSRLMSKNVVKSMSRQSRARSELSTADDDSPANTLDDLIVHAKSKAERKTPYRKIVRNPHFDMLYCNKSETDMIKWKSNYKQTGLEVSASDEFSKKAEILTKKIAKEFYEWWVGLGNVEFKSEIKRPEDIEDLFQVWFDEHASRGLVLDPRILPCVLQSVADYVGVKKTGCPGVLKRQIAYDIHAETSPAHTLAFGTCLPQKYKHIPPKNNTKEMWHSVKIPEDLKSMAAVWDDIQHLTSTKTFHQWLQKRPHMPMPPFFKSLEKPGEKKLPFVVPSDFVVRDKASSMSAQELALPVSQFDLELKDVLSKLMNE
ncbi:uncharacterized protein LOC123715340 [Pieris brassicae]|uniref:uncharacterized protein LOC123715340 n=1 Tax=Pieris brassicae TaxID=7116 RepID=UPI001E662696|nr:uncharacterized protein LOC123715340 [Pieris brassicae]